MPASETMDDQLPKHSCIGIIVLATAFLVYFSLGFLVSEAAHASSTPAESDHFCAFDDLEANGTVGFSDFLIFAGAFGKS